MKDVRNVFTHFGTRVSCNSIVLPIVGVEKKNIEMAQKVTIKSWMKETECKSWSCVYNVNVKFSKKIKPMTISNIMMNFFVKIDFNFEKHNFLVSVTVRKQSFHP